MTPRPRHRAARVPADPEARVPGPILQAPTARAGPASDALSFGRAAGGVANAASGGTGPGGGDPEAWLGPPSFPCRTPSRSWGRARCRCPAAHPRISRARRAVACAVFERRVQFSSISRSSALSTNSAIGHDRLGAWAFSFLLGELRSVGICRRLRRRSGAARAPPGLEIDWSGSGREPGAAEGARRMRILVPRAPSGARYGS
jgi:hypothetical protein